MKFDLVCSDSKFLREREAVASGLGSHAYIIDGSEGVGKMSYALALSCVYFCKSEKKPCFECSGCRKVLDSAHPDVHIVTPEKNFFTVDLARQIISTVYETPYEGGSKIYILEDFHNANPQAQNALLKTLEEPPRSVTFFLLTENYYALLDTVRSRCKRIHINGFTPAEIYSQLEKIHPGNPDLTFASENSGGVIGKALRMLDDEEAMRISKIACETVNSIKSSPSAVDIALTLESEKESVLPLLDCLEDCIVSEFRKGNPAFWMERIGAVRDARDKKKKNVNIGLIIDELAYSLAKGGIKWQR